MSIAGNILETLPISTLHPSMPQWTIKARVTARSELRTWSKNGRSGTLFCVNLLDVEGGEMKGVFFNEAADRWSSSLELDSVYLFPKGKLKVASKRFCSPSIQYECVWKNDAEISKVDGDTSSIQHMGFSFVSLDKISAMDADVLVNVLAVVHDFGQLSSVVLKKSGQQRQRRSAILLDDSCSSLVLTLWGVLAENELTVGQVIAIKSCRVSTFFHNKSLSTTETSYVDGSPATTIQQAVDLQRWYDTTGKTIAVMSSLVNNDVVVRKTFAQVELEVENHKINYHDNERGNVTWPLSSATAFVVTLPRSNKVAVAPTYMACPKCHRKVAENCEGWCCEACQRAYPEPDKRYIASVMALDATGTTFLKVFDDVGNVIFGCTASEMQAYDSNNVEGCFEQANFKQYVFKIRPKVDFYAGQTYVHFHAQHAQPIDFVAESRLLLLEIRMLQQNQ
eukprot:GILK01019554.1.p1 GENE.GILK01019554.1~~GILK01019554.1.p1  ORF type:complete len:451 (+),score=31.00 GILK01019554.1:461-1813(+)